MGQKSPPNFHDLPDYRTTYAERDRVFVCGGSESPEPFMGKVIDGPDNFGEYTILGGQGFDYKRHPWQLRPMTGEVLDAWEDMVATGPAAEAAWEHGYTAAIEAPKTVTIAVTYLETIAA